MAIQPRTWPLARPDLEGFERPGTRSTRCLLLHGFTSTPREMFPLADSLSAAGYPVTAIRLPGHGTSVADLERTRAEEWIAAAETALQQVAAERPVFMAGQSMGGLLSMLLASRYPEKVLAVASLAAPIRVARWGEPFFRHTGLWRLIRYVPKGISDLPPDMLPQYFTYDRFPIRGVLALADVVRLTRAALPALRAPLLVMHGKLDRSAPFVSSDWLFDLAGSPRKEFVAMEHSHHLLTLDVEREAVCAKVVAFFESVG